MFRDFNVWSWPLTTGKLDLSNGTFKVDCSSWIEAKSSDFCLPIREHTWIGKSVRISTLPVVRLNFLVEISSSVYAHDKILLYFTLKIFLKFPVLWGCFNSPHLTQVWPIARCRAHQIWPENRREKSKWDQVPADFFRNIFAQVVFLIKLVLLEKVVKFLLGF